MMQCQAIAIRPMDGFKWWGAVDCYCVLRPYRERKGRRIKMSHAPRS